MGFVPPVSEDDIGQPTWIFRLTGGVVTWLVPLSLLLFVASIGLYVAVNSSRLAPQPVPGGGTAVLGAAGTFVAVIIIHEALHGVGFALFGGRPKFGVALVSWMPAAYTACPGRRFTRGQFLVIGALPLLVIDIAALGLGAFAPLAGIGVVAISINSAGAVADLWTIGLLLQSPRGSLFEDSDGRSIVAWHPPGSGARLPRGLNPPGLHGTGLMVAALLLSFPLVTFPLVALGELLLAMALGGTLRVAGVDVTVVGRRDGHNTARQNIGATFLVALLVTLMVAAALQAARRRRRRQ